MSLYNKNNPAAERCELKKPLTMRKSLKVFVNFLLIPVKGPNNRYYLNLP